ncbi:MAG: hypothetical protein M0R17_06875 [Candidatus Omnitrophica bacterium]|nr:hypothetical protein [Candidatus Omnitrophota bacterium]
MTKHMFITHLTNCHNLGVKAQCIEYLHNITRLSNDLCSKIVNSLWGCSNPKYFGNNIYNLLKASADSDNSVQFEPKTKSIGCTVYIIYPDEHAAAYALYKIKQFKS